MALNISYKSVGKKMTMAILAQLVSLTVAFVLNLIVPKFITIEEYSYWQTFALYVSYVGVLHFGLLDGLMLRYSQFDWEEIDKVRLRSQFFTLASVLLFFSITGVLISMILDDAISSKLVLLVSIGIISKNVFTFNSYVFQLTNRIEKYAVLTIIHRLIMGIVIIVLIILKVQNFIWYCCAELCADFVSFIITSRWNRSLYWGRIPNINYLLSETTSNVYSGIKLLIANWASMFLIGSARMVIQWRWDLITFGKVSFAFSLTNLFLSIITAVSIVFFPTIKRLDNDRLPLLYIRTRGILNKFLFAALILYFPLSYILKLWLPQYSQSIYYLGILLPIIVFSSKVMLLTNNYLKAYRKEGLMLKINIFSVSVSILGFIVSAFVFGSIDLLLVWALIAIIMRSVISELVVSNIINVNFKYEYVMEVFMVLGFVLCSSFIHSIALSCLIYTAIYLGYVFVSNKFSCKVQ